MKTIYCIINCWFIGLVLIGCLPSSGVGVEEEVSEPKLDIKLQMLAPGEYFTYLLDSESIVGISDGDNPIIEITSDGGTGIELDGDAFSSSRPLTEEGTYTVKGTITVGAKVIPWSFTITVEPSEKVLLSIPLQKVVEGRGFSFTLSESSNILNIPSGGSYSISVDADGGEGASVTYDAVSREFSGSNIEPGTHNITGTISDGSNQSNWSFGLRVLFNPPPAIDIANQYVEAGEGFLYEIADQVISGIASDEVLTVTFGSDGGSGLEFDDTRTFSSQGHYDDPGSYVIKGTASDGYKVSEWVFNLIVRDTIAPALSIPRQVIDGGQMFSYAISRLSITNLRSVETYSISISDDGGSGVTYDATTNTFEKEMIEDGDYIISGRVSDGNNSSRWSFPLVVNDKTAPVLNIANQVINMSEKFTFTIDEAEHITHRKPSESYTITVANSSGLNISYDEVAKTFTAESLAPSLGIYLIAGTIEDAADPPNTSNWSFTIDAQGDAPTAISLAINPQSVEVGDAFSYTVQVGDILNPGTGNPTISIGNDDSSGITWNATTRAFVRTTPFTSAEIRVYTIQGTIADSANTGTSDWIFVVNVVASSIPQLSISNQVIDELQGFSFIINAADNISGVLSGESATITMSSHGDSQIEYNQVTKTFSGTNIPYGSYTITGKIAAGGDESDWEFILTALDKTAPQISIANQSVREGREFSFAFDENAVTQLRNNESYTLTIQNDGGAGMTLTGRAFSADTRALTPQTYEISGTIQDQESPPNTAQWSFQLEVLLNDPPVLNVANQELNVGETFSYQLGSVGGDLSGVSGADETLSVIIQSDGGSGVVFSGDRFYRNTAFVGPGLYTLEGTISDGFKSSNWSFSINVTAFQFMIADQTIDENQAFSYTINESTDISGTLNGGSYSITIDDDDDGSGVTYNATTKTFSASSVAYAEPYTITGTITTGSRTSNWSFRIVVNDKTAPLLSLSKFTVRSGTAFNHALQRSEIGQLRAGEDYSVSITSDDSSGMSYLNGAFKVADTNIDLRIYNIAGTIEDGESPPNSSDWAFEFEVATGNLPPSLNIPEQNLDTGDTFTLSLADHAGYFSGFEAGDVAAVTLGDDGGSQVRYRSNGFTFYRNTPFTQAGRYTLTGTISDGTSSRPWSFDIVVAGDSVAPVLTIPSQEEEIGGAFGFTIVAADHITLLEATETFTVAMIGDGGSGMAFDVQGNTFSLSAVERGPYTIAGTISDNSGNSSNWSFTLSGKDSTAPQLNLGRFTLNEGEELNYTLLSNDIGQLRNGETYEISITNDGGTGIVFNNGQLRVSDRTLTAQVYTVQGTIQDGESPANQSSWSLDLEVMAVLTPQLNITTQAVTTGEVFSYQIQSADITGVIAGNATTVTLESDDGSGVLFSAENSTFSRSTRFDAVATYTLTGTISSGSKSSSWSFDIQVTNHSDLYWALPSQSVLVGQPFEHTLVSTEISHILPGESFTIAIASDGGTGITYDNQTQIFHVSAVPLGISLITGTITGSSGRPADWFFDLIGFNTFTPPRLNIADQTVVQGDTFSLVIDELQHITDLVAGGGYLIRITVYDGTGMNYDINTKTFTCDVGLLEVREYNIRGSISDTEPIPNQSDWSFKLIVEANTQAGLQIADQSTNHGQIFSYEIQDSEISGIGTAETAIIKLTSDDDSGVIVHTATKKFSSLQPLEIGEYTLAGTISDGLTAPTSWSFLLTVTDGTAPILYIGEQLLDKGKDFSYQINEKLDIFNLREGESYSISNFNNGASGITYNSTQKKFSKTNISQGVHTLSGTVLDESGNSSNWQFKVVVSGEGPRLNIPDQSFEQGTPFSFIIDEATHITQLPSGAQYVITITNGQEIGIEYTASTKRLSSSYMPTVGKYLIEGKITTNDRSAVATKWSFIYTVSPLSTSFGMLIAPQKVNQGDTFSYTISESDKVGTIPGTPTITLTSDGGSGVGLSNNIFSSNGALTVPGEYTLSGTISDGTDTTNWFFTLVVLGTIEELPKLDIPNQEIAEGQNFIYTINDAINVSGVTGSYTIEITSMGGSGITYDADAKGFSGSPRPGHYVLRGKILSNGKSSPWSYSVEVIRVRPPTFDVGGPIFVFEGSKFSYPIARSHFRNNYFAKGYKLAVTDDDGTGIEFSMSEGAFRSEENLSTPPGEYIIKGTIVDSRHVSNVGHWTMRVVISGANYAPIDTISPSLRIVSVEATAGICFNLTPPDIDFLGINDINSVALTVDPASAAATGVQVSGKTFYGTKIFNNPGELYTVYGELTADGKRSNYAFNIIVKDEANPRLNISDQVITEGGVFSYQVQDSNISHSRPNEKLSIYLRNGSSRFIAYQNRTFSGHDLRAGVYIIAGVITDGVNEGNWSFRLRVQESSTQLKVLDLSRSNNGNWSWSCSSPPCNYRYVFSQVMPEEFTTASLTMDYASGASVSQPDGEGYFYIQAKKGQNGESLISYAKYEDDLNEFTAKEIALGQYHACVILRENGQVSCWGSNLWGILGRGNTEVGWLTPAQINLGSNLIADSIAAGDEFNCAILVNATGGRLLKCWGLNADGQLGQGHAVTIGTTSDLMADSLPAINLGTNVEPRSVHANDSSACAILTSGQVKCWGEINSKGTLDDQMGDNLPVLQLGSGLTARSVSFGGKLLCVNLSNATTKCWVDGLTESHMVSFGQGHIVQDLFVGSGSSCALFTNGRIKCWGWGNFGALGQDSAEHVVLKDRAYSLANLDPVNLGTDELGLPLMATDMAVSNGLHTCALLENDRVKCWGGNTSGQLGQDHRNNIGDGWDRGGEKISEMGNALVYTNVGSGVGVVAIDLGLLHSCAITDDFKVKCWGDNHLLALSSLRYEDGIQRTDPVGDGLDVHGARSRVSEMGDYLKRAVLGAIPSDYNTPPYSNDSTSLVLKIDLQEIKAGENFSYTIRDYDIIGLRKQEAYSITISNTSDATVTFNNTTKALSGQTSALTPGYYIIEGAITDGHSNSSSWRFPLSVMDATAPVLDIASQTISVGQSFNYTIDTSTDITGLATGEEFDLITTNDGGVDVTYDPATKQLSIQASLLSAQAYTISGFLLDRNGNSSTWSFDLVVEPSRLFSLKELFGDLPKSTSQVSNNGEESNAMKQEVGLLQEKRNTRITSLIKSDSGWILECGGSKCHARFNFSDLPPGIFDLETFERGFELIDFIEEVPSYAYLYLQVKGPDSGELSTMSVRTDFSALSMLESTGRGYEMCELKNRKSMLASKCHSQDRSPLEYAVLLYDDAKLIAEDYLEGNFTSCEIPLYYKIICPD